MNWSDLFVRRPITDELRLNILLHLAALWSVMRSGFPWPIVLVLMMLVGYHVVYCVHILNKNRSSAVLSVYSDYVIYQGVKYDTLHLYFDGRFFFYVAFYRRGVRFSQIIFADQLTAEALRLLRRHFLALRLNSGA
jgi:hypothetical protein